MPYVIARNKYAIVTKQSRWNLESAYLISTRLPQNFKKNFSQ